jgi:hypothetical protein
MGAKVVRADEMDGDALVEYSHRALVVESELQDLFEMAWGSRKCDFGPVLARSFTWITARVRGRLIGFVNVGAVGADRWVAARSGLAVAGRWPSGEALSA